MAKRTRRGQKQCPNCKKWLKGTRAKECPRCGHQFTGKQTSKPAPAPVAEEKPAKVGDTFTIEQVRAVAQTVTLVGGLARLNELLGLIKEVGGAKKFKELAEAMTVTEPVAIPF